MPEGGRDQGSRRRLALHLQPTRPCWVSETLGGGLGGGDLQRGRAEANTKPFPHPPPTHPQPRPSASWPSLPPPGRGNPSPAQSPTCWSPPPPGSAPRARGKGRWHWRPHLQWGEPGTSREVQCPNALLSLEISSREPTSWSPQRSYGIKGGGGRLGGRRPRRVRTLEFGAG